MAEIIGFAPKTFIQKHYKLTCPECGCIARYNHSEIIDRGYQYNDYCYSVVKCPNCGHRISFDEYKQVENPELGTITLDDAINFMKEKLPMLNEENSKYFNAIIGILSNCKQK